MVSLRPAGSEDWPLIRGWLARPEVERWWGSLAAAEAAVIAAMNAPMGLCSVIEADGRPAGYAQALETGSLGERVPSALVAGTFHVEAFVGEPGFRNRGVGQAALRLVADEVFQTTLTLGLVVVVALAHEPAVRAYEKAGFRWVRVIDDPLVGPSWLMRLDRPGKSVTR